MFLEISNQDRYRKMSADYEAEQERLKLEIEVIEEWVEQREEMNDGLDAFIALTQKYVDVEELTQTIVNEYIKKIIVSCPGQIQRQAQAESEDFLQLRGRCRYSRYFRAYHHANNL